jgi:hypothetical protein
MRQITTGLKNRNRSHFDTILDACRDALLSARRQNIVTNNGHEPGVVAMKIHALTCAAALVALPASAQEVALAIDLIPGHPVYHEFEKEAGVAMALSITPDQHGAMGPMELCEELQITAGLGHESGDELRLETIFVVPYKGMAIEGFYLPGDGTFGSNALVRGKDIARAMLDGIVSRAGIPPRILDEKKVEHEISCTPGEPVWFIAWHDVRPIGKEDPEDVIERARQRFLAVHESVVEHHATDQHLQAARRATSGG